MSLSNFNVRGIPEEIMLLLKREAKRLHTSINVLILKMIERSVGYSHEKLRHHDLDQGSPWLSANRQAMTDEKPHPTRTDLARQIAEEYASDQREIIKMLRKLLN